ncbi:sirohydrochlorin chelatase, partial [Micromonospora sonneratiae]
MRSARMRGGIPTPVVLVAHGSRDPRAAEAIEDLVRAVATERPGVDVRASYLDHTEPTPEQVLYALESAGHRKAVLVPLLLTDAYHGRVDIPGVLTAARAGGLRLSVRVTEVLGPSGGVVDDLLLAGLRRRLAEVAPAEVDDGPAIARVDAIVLAAAGTRDAGARRVVEVAAAALGGS